MIITNSEPLDPSECGEPGPIIGWALYAIGVHRLREGAAAAQLKGWQYISPAAKTGKVTTRYILPAPKETVNDAVSHRAKAAYNQLVALPGVPEPGQAYEVRALRVHALQLQVMWLHSVKGGASRVIPFASYIGDLQVGHVYTFAAFLEIAQREAGKLKLAPAY